MTFEERLSELGVETRDIIPSDKQCSNTYEKFFTSAERICKEMGEEFDLEWLTVYLALAVAKRDNIIDRMETRLNNVIGELDCLVKICTNCRDCRSCKSYDICDDEDIECNQYYSAYEYAGIPEDWSVDDEQS